MRLLRRFAPRNDKKGETSQLQKEELLAMTEWYTVLRISYNEFYVVPMVY
jgi:hypothetical protein